MASALYLENFIESEFLSALTLPQRGYWCITHVGIETLPQELQRNFTLMRSLDQRTEGTPSMLLSLGGTH